MANGNKQEMKYRGNRIDSERIITACTHGEYEGKRVSVHKGEEEIDRDW